MKASAIIYTREKYIGFPKMLKAKPEEMTAQTEEKLLPYVHEAMESLDRENRLPCQVLASADGYVVLGAAFYLRDLEIPEFAGQDRAGRMVHGFVGFVWKKEDFSAGIRFPDTGDCARVISEWIAPHWEDSENSKWAEQTLLIPYQYELSVGNEPELHGYLPSGFGFPVFETWENRNKLLTWTAVQAAAGKNVSVCTNVTVYDTQYHNTRFKYIALSRHCAMPRGNAPEKNTRPAALEIRSREPVKPVERERNQPPAVVTGTSRELAVKKNQQNPAAVLLMIIGGVLLVAALVLWIMKLPLMLISLHGFAVLRWVLFLTGLGCLLEGIALHRKEKTTRPAEPVKQAQVKPDSGLDVFTLIDEKQNPLPGSDQKPPVNRPAAQNRKEQQDDLFSL